MKKFLLLFVLFSNYAFTQTLNDYEYVLVPIKFNIFKENDKFRLNTNVKLLLQKYGFKSHFVTDSVPSEIANTNCKKLYADLEKDNNFNTTKLKIVLKDCNERIVFQTDFGSSKDKQLLVAYNQALREASKSFDKLNYQYNGKSGGVSETVSVIKKVENETSPTNETLPINTSESFYFAQPTPKGFQVIDNEPKVIIKLYYTSQRNVFLGVKGSTNGVLILKDNQWFFEYIENGKILSEQLKLKF
jgi:hypothetical protein